MIRIACRFLLLVAVVAALSGCVIPYHYTGRPGVKGRVVDARTRAPVPGAEVSIAETGGQAIDRTAADGTFSIPPRKQWGVYIIPADVFLSPYQFSVRQTGYRTYQEKLLSSVLGGVRGGGGDTADVGTVRLAPQ